MQLKKRLLQLKPLQVIIKYLKKSPKKIVVLDYGVADTIRALGKEDSIVGLPIDRLPSYLSDFKNKKVITNVGNLKEVNLEKIAELEPDLNHSI